MSKPCDFLLMRYVPDPFKNEFVNIGVLLFGREDDYAGVRFTRDWSRVRCLDPQADIEVFEVLEGDLREQMRTPELRKQTMYRLQETLSTGLQLSNSHGLLSDSPEQDLKHLARTYLGRISNVLYQKGNLGLEPASTSSHRCGKRSKRQEFGNHLRRTFVPRSTRTPATR